MRQENIQSIIKQIKNEFERLKDATDYIDNSKEEVEEVLRFTQKLSNTLITKFSEIIEKIDKSFYSQTAEYKSEYNKFKKEIDKYKNELKLSASNVFQNLEKPINQFNELSAKTEQIISKIDAINFPERLDKLENNVNSTIAEISLANKELNKQSEGLINEIENIKFAEKFNELKKEIQISIAHIEKLNNEFESKIDDKLQIQNKKSENLINTVSQIDIPNKINELKTELNETSSKILTINEKTISKTENLTKEIEEIHISSRLDKLDATIAGITQSTQSVLQRFESLERNIKEGQQNKANDILNRIEKTETKLHEQNRNTENKFDTFETNYKEITKSNQKQIFDRFEHLEKQNKTMKILIIAVIILSIVTIGLQFID